MTTEIPDTLAECADQWFLARERRLAMQKEVDLLEEKEKQLKAYLIDNLPKSHASGIAGQLVQVHIKLKHRPTVVDKEKFYAYIKKKNAFDLLGAAPLASGVRARWEAGEQVPGVKRYSYKDLAYSALKS